MAKRQRGYTTYRVYRFIEEYVEKNGYPPTVAEICHGLGFSSKGSVACHLLNLEKQGMIERSHKRARAIRIIPIDKQ